ncbi:hypothetical protein [Streptomyces tauricus]|uniref:hypothetical protein n=1 Tax=Streptomyces tauricus TaxID=68274 RepID=UPI002244E894|nr:hypothetical protein [Streptomyces tauricus]MCW8097335.1 hypothetical protein [Streptomyces tauricus]
MTISLSHRRGRIMVGASAAILAVAGFGIYGVTADDTDVASVNVEFILGGGSDTNGTGDNLATPGRYQGLAASSDGTVYLFTQENDGMVMWQRKPSGAIKRTSLSGLDEAQAEQAAVAPDGSVYLAADDLWRVDPRGKAVKVIDTDCKKHTPLATVISKFCTEQVTGVAVAEDGSVYIGDQVIWGDDASYVHKVDGDSIELMAGRPPKAGESYELSNPAVKNGINPDPGTKATDVLVSDNLNSGWLAMDGEGLYWRNGPGIVRINHDSTLSPFVAAESPEEITEAESPFAGMGRARDAEIRRNVSDATRGDLAVIPGRSEVYYSDGGAKYKPTKEGAFRWRGIVSDSQEKLLDESGNGKAVYQVAGGKLAPVIAGVQALATSADSLYIAVESESGNDRDSPENWNTAVLRVKLPAKKEH